MKTQFFKENKHTLLSICWWILAWKCLIIWSSVLYNRCGVPFEYCIWNTYNTFVLNFLCINLYGLNPVITLTQFWIYRICACKNRQNTNKCRWFLSRWVGKTFFHKANISVCKNFKYSNSRWLPFEFPSNRGQLHNYSLTICTSLLHRPLLIMHKQ